MTAPAWGFQGGHGHHGGSTAIGSPASYSGHTQHHPSNFPGAGHVVNYNPGIILGYGAGGSFAYSPSFFVVGQGGFFPPSLPPVPFNEPRMLGFGFGGGPGGLMLPLPPLDNATRPAQPRRASPARAKELVELGDRSFRGDNTRRAEDRYRHAIKADPAAVAPHVRLAQVELVRGHYKEAAAHLRTAVATGAGTGWLANAPDIQSIFSEPGDFAKQLGKLETHLQANPGDRDAWFVLGAEWYLSGRTRQAADVFQRLSDRQPDAALAAFLDVAGPPKPDPK